MSDVKNEEQAVHALRRGVARFSQDLTQTLQAVRRESAALDEKVKRTEDRRRRELARAEQELARAREALSRATEAESAELQYFLREAERRCAEARDASTAARHASARLRAATTELLRTMQKVEGSVGEQSSAATAALTALDARLKAYTQGPGLLKGAVTGVAIVGNLASNGQGLVQTSADVAKAVGVETSLVDAAAHQDLTDYTLDRDRQGLEYLAEKQIEEARSARRRGGAS